MRERSGRSRMKARLEMVQSSTLHCSRSTNTSYISKRSVCSTSTCHTKFHIHVPPQFTQDAYEFGHGALFRKWLRHKEQISGNSDHPVQHSDKKMKRYVGNRHPVNFENALICYYMAEKYQEWLKEHCMTLKENKLHYRL